jgi:hypothetical protein
MDGIGDWISPALIALAAGVIAAWGWWHERKDKGK